MSKIEKAEKLSKELAENADRKKIVEMEEKLPSKNKGPIAKIWSKVQDLYKAFLSDATPDSVKFIIIGALLYLVLPFDVVPDVIPVAGLADDAALIAYLWTKLSKLLKFGVKNVPKVIGEGAVSKAKELLKTAYEKLFETAKIQLEKSIKKQRKKMISNGLINLSLFLASLVLLNYNSGLSVLIASLLLIFSFGRSLISFFRSIPTIFTLTKHFFKTKANIDETVSLFLKEKYPLIEKIEQKKKGIEMLEGIPDLSELIKLQRKALASTIIESTIFILFFTVLLWFLRRYLMSEISSYTFWSLLILPINQLISLIK